MGCIERIIVNGATVERDCHTGQPVGRKAKLSGPSLLKKAVNFATAAAKHMKAGMPRASAAELERRFAICQGCEFYDGTACTKCGCPVVREKKYLSKLAWADSECPAGKWGKEAKNAVDNS